MISRSGGDPAGIGDDDGRARLPRLRQRRGHAVDPGHVLALPGEERGERVGAGRADVPRIELPGGGRPGPEQRDHHAAGQDDGHRGRGRPPPAPSGADARPALPGPPGRARRGGHDGGPLAMTGEEPVPPGLLALGAPTMMCRSSSLSRS